MEQEGSLPHSQQPATYSYFEPDKFSIYETFIALWDQF
jgi:hypothetical protein